MSIIYSFLQKRKLHESQHGFIMVFIAYALSALMLILGSDVFYNIDSAAAGMSALTNEETQNLVNAGLYGLQSDEYTAQVTKTELVNPYGLADTATESLDKTSAVQSSTGGDTVWFFGDAMDEATFDNIMVQLGNTMDDITKAKDSKDATTSSLSTQETMGTVYGDITKKEIQMLERIVQAEAGGEDMVGKILIVNVVMNRVEDKHFPDTIKNVIFQKKDGDYQFSPVGSGRYWSVRISDETKEAVKRALAGDDYSKGALYFVARDKTDSASIGWFDNNLDRLFEHGGHEFYKNK